jgi:hypothetical protein
MIRRFQRDLGFVGDRHTRFLRGLPVDEHDAGENQRARTLTRLSEPALYEKQIQTLFQSANLPICQSANVNSFS